MKKLDEALTCDPIIFDTSLPGQTRIFLALPAQPGRPIFFSSSLGDDSLIRVDYS
jgi:hypothetical protein